MAAPAEGVAEIMSTIDMPPPKKLYSVQIERLPMGGYLIMEPALTASSQRCAAFIAACSTMGDVLQFLNENMEPSLFKNEPSFEEMLEARYPGTLQKGT